MHRISKSGRPSRRSRIKGLVGTCAAAVTLVGGAQAVLPSLASALVVQDPCADWGALCDYGDGASGGDFSGIDIGWGNGGSTGGGFGSGGDDGSSIDGSWNDGSGGGGVLDPAHDLGDP